MKVQIVITGEEIAIFFSAPKFAASVFFEPGEARKLAKKLADSADDLESTEHILARSVDELDLSVRAANCLQALGAATIGDITRKTQSELLKQKYLTMKVVKEIKAELAKLRLKLKG